jgi:hypothetical protein
LPARLRNRSLKVKKFGLTGLSFGNKEFDIVSFCKKEDDIVIQLHLPVLNGSLQFHLVKKLWRHIEFWIFVHVTVLILIK